MADVLEYKCPCCGGGIAFDSSAQKEMPVLCTEFELESLKEFERRIYGGRL